MKFYIVFALIAVVSAADFTEEQKEKARANAAACIKQEGVTKEQAVALRSGDFSAVDDKTKCFANCFLEQSGFIVDGKIQEDVINTKLGPVFGADTVKSVQTKCNSVQGADKCDTSYQLYKCYYEQKAAF